MAAACGKGALCVSTLQAYLAEKKETIIRQWLARTADGSADAPPAVPLQERDRFHNPAAFMLTEGLSSLFDDVMRGNAGPESAEALDAVLRVLILQTPDRDAACSFASALNDIVRAETRGRPDLDSSSLDDLQRQTDALVREAARSWERCREQIGRIREYEIQRFLFVPERILVRRRERKGICP